jgi:peptide/nickel transport system substrate-binding protein
MAPTKRWVGLAACRRGAVAVALVCVLVAPALGQSPARATSGRAEGGTLTVTTQTDIPSLDPAIAYDWTGYNTIHNIFNALLEYKPGTLQLEPAIAAAMPAISANGLVWTFTLRKGVLFQTPVNREVHASDFKYSWERILNPKTASPGSGFFMSIAGAAEYAAGKAKDVSGIKALGPYTLQIQLIRPYVPFKYVCAMTFAYVVPREIVEKYPKDFSHHVVGTGAFMLSQWIPGQKIVLVRNPHFFEPGLPHLQSVVFNVGPTPSVAILQVQRGEADIPTDEIPAQDYLSLKTDPQWSSRIYRIPSVATSYIWMDTLAPPFTNRLVRQAVAMAINKKRIIAVGAAGLGSVTGGVLPPLMPCYDPNLKTWPYDPAKARQVLAQAGYPHGFSTTITASGTSVAQARVEEVMQQNLAAIGIKAAIKMAVGSTYVTLITTPKAVQIAQTGWTLDYPDPSDFIDPILTTPASMNGGSNFAFYRNPTVDALAARADQELDATKRCTLYHQLEQIIVTDAPWVPLYTPVHADIVSSHVGGFYMSPVWYEFDFEYYHAQ